MSVFDLFVVFSSDAKESHTVRTYVEREMTMRRENSRSHRRIATLARHLTTTTTTTNERHRKRRIGIIGYGKVGRFLCERVRAHPDVELAFVIDLFTSDTVLRDETVPSSAKLERIEDFESTRPDLVVEVAHPDVVKKFGLMILRKCNLMVASTTAMADSAVGDRMMKEATRPSGFGLYLASGALWGGRDIQKMSENGTLRELTITMVKHPASLKLKGLAATKLSDAEGRDGEITLYDGPLRDLCFMAPNNVNTMATAGFAALKTTGFEKTRAILRCDRGLRETIITVDAIGTVPGAEKDLRIFSRRVNPSVTGAVTGQGTLLAFFSSLLVASTGKHGDGYHLC